MRTQFALLFLIRGLWTHMGGGGGGGWGEKAYWREAWIALQGKFPKYQGSRHLENETLDMKMFWREAMEGPAGWNIQIWRFQVPGKWELWHENVLNRSPGCTCREFFLSANIKVPEGWRIRVCSWKRFWIETLDSPASDMFIIWRYYRMKVCT